MRPEWSEVTSTLLVKAKFDRGQTEHVEESQRLFTVDCIHITSTAKDNVLYHMPDLLELEDDVVLQARIHRLDIWST